MALTYSPTTGWAESSANGSYVATLTVTATTAENDAYTLRTPKGLDPTKPWILSLHSSAAPDGATAIPVDLWIGWSDNFALAGNDNTTLPLVSNTGGNFKTIMDDAKGAVSGVVYQWIMDPYMQVADVVTLGAIASGLKVRVPIAPYYIFNLDGAGTLDAHSATWTITQKK